MNIMMNEPETALLRYKYR